MDLHAIITFALAVLALALKPGPGMMMLMSRSISQGAGALFTMLLGVLVITFAYLVVVFISFKIPGLDMVFITILVKSVAAVYLIYLGIKGLKDISLAYNVNDIEGHGFFDNLSAAIMLTISNPLVIVFYAGILPTLLDINAMTFNDMAIITIVVLSIEGIVPILYCLPMILLRKKIPISFLKGLRVFSSIVIIIVGLYIGYSALPAMDVISAINLN